MNFSDIARAKSLYQELEAIQIATQDDFEYQVRQIYGHAGVVLEILKVPFTHWNLSSLRDHVKHKLPFERFIDDLDHFVSFLALNQKDLDRFISNFRNERNFHHLDRQHLPKDLLAIFQIKQTGLREISATRNFLDGKEGFETLKTYLLTEEDLGVA